jgi:hypothetical protein
VIRTLAIASLILSAVLLTPACAAPLKDDPPGAAGALGTSAGKEKAVTENRSRISQRFADLDAYLAYLEKRSHLDGSWYREIRPGVYELQTGNLRLPDGGDRKRIFTREELEKKFGFSQ